MTYQQYTDIINCYKSLLANELDDDAVSRKHLAAILERDRQLLAKIDTSHIDEYIHELETIQAR